MVIVAELMRNTTLGLKWTPGIIFTDTQWRKGGINPGESTLLSSYISIIQLERDHSAYFAPVYSAPSTILNL